MHVSDALISPPVALGAGVITISLIAVAAKKVKEIKNNDIVPLMGIMGAFVFAAQMINFTIPGTGSSGHLIGGILLASILGPWCAFITLTSTLIVQSLFFADGGILALGCNILNMGATSCLIAYPFIFKPLVRHSISPVKIMTASIISSIIALQIGALGVISETELSGVTFLPFKAFASFMLPIHLVIGFAEGLVTGGLIIFISKYRPAILNFTEISSSGKENRKKVYKFIIVFAVFTLILAGGFTLLASEYPDGLEWSIEKVSGIAELDSPAPATAIMPDYESKFSGIIGSLIVMVLLWALSHLFFSQLKKIKKSDESSENHIGV